MGSQDSSGFATPLFRKSTASSLLAKFSPSHTQHKMIASPSTPGHSMRSNLPISPTVSHGASGSQRRRFTTNQPTIIDLVGDDELNADSDEIIQYVPRSQRRRPLRPTKLTPKQLVSSLTGYSEFILTNPSSHARILWLNCLMKMRQMNWPLVLRSQIELLSDKKSRALPLQKDGGF